MSPKSSTNSPTPSKQDLIKEGLSPWACISCATRKVRCDRKKPCSTCSRAGLPCEYKAPAPPQRKRRKAERDALNAMIDRLKNYEDYMRSTGAPFEPFDISTLPNQEGRRMFGESTNDEMSQSGEAGDEGWQTSGYSEETLLANLNREFRHTVSPDEPGSDNVDITGDKLGGRLVSSILLGGPSSPGSPWNGPPPISGLWQTFCNNIHPMTHVIHVPTVQQELLVFSGSQNSPDSSSKALVFGICSCALLSLTDAECYSLLGSPRLSSLTLLQSETRNQLLASDFLTAPNTTSLQAFALFVTSLQATQHPHTTSLLTNVGVHTARILGLHRDGSRHGLRPFETEMRRRIWWYILFLHSRASELQGLVEPLIPPQSDALLPLNLDDQHLQPDMQQLPTSETEPTEMIFCFVRYVLMKMSHQLQQSLQERQSEGDPNPERSLAADFERITQLENHIEERYLGSCDASSPLHAMTSAFAKSATAKMRLQALSASVKTLQKNGSAPDDYSTKRTFFAHSLRLIGYDNFLQSRCPVREFTWYIRHHFPWGALINLLRALMTEDPILICGTPENLIKAWQQMDQLHRHNPEFLQVPSPAVKRVQAQACDMTLQAWNNCYRLLPPKATADPPDFIQILQTRKQAVLSGTSNPQPPAATPASSDHAPGWVESRVNIQPPMAASGVYNPGSTAAVDYLQPQSSAMFSYPAAGPGDQSMFDVEPMVSSQPLGGSQSQWNEAQFPGFAGRADYSGDYEWT